MSATAMNADDLRQRSEPAMAAGTGGWRAVTAAFYRLLGLLACLAMVAAFVTVGLGVVARQAGFDIPGLDAYAGYSIAAALFLALPMTLQHGDHIRVGLVLDKLPPRARNVLEYWSLGAGLALALYVAYYAGRLVWVSYTTHDVSQSMDATPLWIPQIAMALGSLGFAVAMADALVSRLQGRSFFASAGDEIARVE